MPLREQQNSCPSENSKNSSLSENSKTHAPTKKQKLMPSENTKANGQGAWQIDMSGRSYRGLWVLT